MREQSVVFPPPEGPTRAMLSPSFTVLANPVKTIYVASSSKQKFSIKKVAAPKIVLTVPSPIATSLHKL